MLKTVVPPARKQGENLNRALTVPSLLAALKGVEPLARL